MNLLLDSKTKPSSLEETRLGTRKQRRNHKKNHESGPRQTTNTKSKRLCPEEEEMPNETKNL